MEGTPGLCDTVCDGELSAQDAVLDNVGFGVEISWGPHLVLSFASAVILLCLGFLTFLS